MVTVAFIWCFWCFNWFSYCRGKCICAGQGNTIVSHFVVQRGDFTVAIACVPCGPRRSLIYAWAWWFCVCWKLSAAEQVKTDCRLRLLWSPLYWLRCLCLVLWPLRSITTLALREQDERSYPRPQQVEWPRPRPQQNPDDDGQPPTPPTPGTTTDDLASHQHHRRPRLATNTTDVAVPQLTTPASHQHHRRPRLATITTDDPG